ncbi:hypothetical protein RCL1_001458 [Eukaryota sp. TZLM3-RCL]
MFPSCSFSPTSTMPIPNVLSSRLGSKEVKLLHEFIPSKKHTVVVISNSRENYIEADLWYEQFIQMYGKNNPQIGGLRLHLSRKKGTKLPKPISEDIEENTVLSEGSPAQLVLELLEDVQTESTIVLLLDKSRKIIYKASGEETMASPETTTRVLGEIDKKMIHEEGICKEKHIIVPSPKMISSKRIMPSPATTLKTKEIRTKRYVKARDDQDTSEEDRSIRELELSSIQKYREEHELEESLRLLPEDFF